MTFPGTLKRLFGYVLVLSLLPCAAGFGLGSAEAVDANPPALATGTNPETAVAYLVEGRVRQVGNSPLIRLLIEDSEGRYFFFSREDAREYTPMTGQIVKVISEVQADPIYAADGKFITVEYMLINPEIRN